MTILGKNIGRELNSAPRFASRRRFLVRSTIVVLLEAVAGCMALNPPPTIATVGGKEAGRRIDGAPEPERIAALTAEISALSPKISRQEAARCADCAVRYTTLLTKTHDLVAPAEWNSLLINIGAKRRGYCFQLADDLNAELAEQKFKTLVFTRAISNENAPFHEHNCIVLTAPGQAFGNGLVLDPWRNPGTLRWARVSLDVQYVWVPRAASVHKPTTQMASR